MTEDRSSRQRWWAAAAIAPLAATAFAVATSFAIDHQPTLTSVATNQSAPGSVEQAALISPAAAAQQARVTAAAAQVRKLQAKVHKLNKRLKTANAGSQGSSGAGMGAAGSGSGSSGGYSAPAQQAAPQTHAATGASGAVR